MSFVPSLFAKFFPFFHSIGGGQPALFLGWDEHADDFTVFRANLTQKFTAAKSGAPISQLYYLPETSLPGRINPYSGTLENVNAVPGQQLQFATGGKIGYQEIADLLVENLQI